MQLLDRHAVCVVTPLPHLPLVPIDGAAFFSARWCCGSERLPVVPGFAAALRSQRNFKYIGEPLHQLLGELFCHCVAIVDRIVVWLCQQRVWEHREPPSVACSHALRQLRGKIGYRNCRYARLLDDAIIHRYFENSDASYLLVQACFVATRQPFYGRYPLHSFPQLGTRAVVRFMRTRPACFELAGPRDRLEAVATVWLAIVRACRSPALLRLVARLSLAHRIIVQGHVRTFHLPMRDAVRRTTNNLMEHYLKSSLLCNE